MKISKKKLKIIIENFLLEKEDEEKNEGLNYEKSFDVKAYTFEIKILSSGVDINVKNEKTAVNDELISLKKDEDNIEKKNKIAKILAGIIDENKNDPEEMNKLVQAIKNFDSSFPLNNETLRTQLVGFRSSFMV